MKYSLKNIDDKVTAAIEDNHRKKQEQASNRLVRDLPTNKHVATDHIDTINVEIVNAGDVTSDDEFVPEIPVDILSLNSQAPTKQQNLLML